MMKTFYQFKNGKITRDNYLLIIKGKYQESLELLTSSKELDLDPKREVFIRILEYLNKL